MISPLNNVPLLQYQNHVSISDGGKAVGNHKDSATFHKLVHSPLNEGFGASVYGAGSFIQNQNWGIFSLTA
jgi:hypothetical protein